MESRSGPMRRVSACMTPDSGLRTPDFPPGSPVALASSGMASLAERVRNAVAEVRILVLATQVLTGFHFLAVFQDRFASLPDYARIATLVAALLSVVSLAFAMSPAAVHQLRFHGQSNRAFERFVARIVTPALLPLIMAAAIDLFIVADVIVSTLRAVVLAMTTCIATLGALGALYWMRRRNDEHFKAENDMEQDDLSENISNLLREARVAIPGAQALLGFQFTIVLTRTFGELPKPLQRLHLAAFVLTLLSLLLLLAPAIYHRIAERGEISEHFFRVGSRLLLAGMAPLPVAIACELYIVATRIVSTPWPMVFAFAFVVTTFLLWYGVGLAQRERA